MIEPTSISISFINELNDHIEAQRVYYRTGFLAKLDKVVAALLLGFGVFCVAFVGLRWWTIIWFPLAVAEWFDLFSLSRWRAKIEFYRNPKFRDEYHLTALSAISFSRLSKMPGKSGGLPNNARSGWPRRERAILPNLENLGKPPFAV